MPHHTPSERQSAQGELQEPRLQRGHQQPQPQHQHQHQLLLLLLQDSRREPAGYSASVHGSSPSLAASRLPPGAQERPAPTTRSAMTSCECSDTTTTPAHPGCSNRRLARRTLLRPPRLLLRGFGTTAPSLSSALLSQLVLLLVLPLGPPPMFWDPWPWEDRSPVGSEDAARPSSSADDLHARVLTRDQIWGGLVSVPPRHSIVAAAAPLGIGRPRVIGLLLVAAATAASSTARAAAGGGGSGTVAATPRPSPLPDGVKGSSLLMRPSFDASLDWASNVTAKGVGGCTLAKDAARPAFMPPRCPKPRRPVGIDEARKLGWRFAPLLHQHSLDWSRLSDPGAWLQSAVLVDPVTYTTTDLRTYLEHRRRARHAKTEKAAAEAAAAVAAAAASSGGDARAKGAAIAAAAKAAAAAAKAAEADPYWLIHEAYDTHNFYATRLVRRRQGSAPPKAAAAAAVPRGQNARQQPQQPQQQQAGIGRRLMEDSSDGFGAAAAAPWGWWRQQQQRRMAAAVKEEEVVPEGGEDRYGQANVDLDVDMDERSSEEEEEEDPFWPHFEALQGPEFFEAIEGDPLIEAGLEAALKEDEKEEEAEKKAGEDGGSGAGQLREATGPAGQRRRRRQVAEGAGVGGGKGATAGGEGRGNDVRRGPPRLGGKVYFTVFEPRLEHLKWTRPRHPAEDTGPAAASSSSGTTAEEPTYAYVYTFWFFYPFNGCSNQLMATRFAGRHQAAEYFLCPLGVHEGDWEHLKVYVCQDRMLDEQEEPARAIVALQYSQHTWLPTYDCTNGSWPGDCSFESDPDSGQLRPRVFAGLHSHANSPYTSNLNVYAKVNFKQLLNFDGIYVADRFAASPDGPLFVPSPVNTLWLPFPHEMGEAEGVRPEDVRPEGRLAWTAYMGNWGVPLTSPNFSITCLRNNLTVAGPCDPRNPPVFILDRLLGGVGARPEFITWTPVLSPKRVALELAEPISGPLVRRAASYSWERELPAPLWDAREPLPGLGGLSLATLARDTSSLACPLAEDVHRTSAWGPAGQFYHNHFANDPRVAHRLRLFVAAATAAVVAAAALSALVVKCMPLILAPHHQHHHHHNHKGYSHRHGYGYGYSHGPYGHDHYGHGHGHFEGSTGGGGGGGEELPHAFGIVYGRYDESLYEPLSQHDDLPRGLMTSPPPYQPQRYVAAALPRRQWDERDASAGGGGGSSGSLSESYSSFNSVTKDSDDEAAAAAPPPPPPLQGVDIRPLPYDNRGNGLSYGGPAAKISLSAGLNSDPPPNPLTAASEDGNGRSGGVAAAATAVQAHRGCSEEQPLLSAALSRGRRDGGSGAGCGGGSGEATAADDDDGGVKARRTVRRGWRNVAYRTAAACPAVKLLPLLAWRGCLTACRCFCGALCYPCRLRLPDDGGVGAADASGSPRRRRRRGLGPYLLGCATQPERRLLWLSLGIMAYSMGLIMSAQGLLETLHALRNLLLRGLWAIAGLEGLFVALLAAGGVGELTLMVAAVSLGPKPRAFLQPSTTATTAPHARQVSVMPEAALPPATAAASTEAAAAAAETLPNLPAAAGGTQQPLPTSSSTPACLPFRSIGPFSALQPPLSSRSSGAQVGGGLAMTAAAAPAGSWAVSGGGAGSDWESYGIPHPHIHFPSTAEVAATAAAATAAATAAASAAASAAATAAAKVPWRTLALLAAVGYMEVAASLHLLGFGLALWVGVLGASEGCSAAVQGLYRVISFSPDVCLDLSVIGVPGPRCGGDLMQMCNVWRQLRLSGLLYGSLLIIAARLLLLIMATANYHSRHAVLLPLPQQQHQHHHGAGGADLRIQNQQWAKGNKGGVRGAGGGAAWGELGGTAGAWTSASGAGGDISRHSAPRSRRKQGSKGRLAHDAAEGEEGHVASIGGGARTHQRQHQHQQQSGGGGGGGGNGLLLQEPRRRTSRQRAAAAAAAAVAAGMAAAAVTGVEELVAGATGTAMNRAGGSGGGGVGGHPLPVSTSAVTDGVCGGGPGLAVVVEMGAMGPAGALAAAGSTAAGGGSGGGGGSSSLASGSGRVRRWGLFGF